MTLSVKTKYINKFEKFKEDGGSADIRDIRVHNTNYVLHVTVWKQKFTVVIIQADPAKLEIGFNKGVCLIVD